MQKLSNFKIWGVVFLTLFLGACEDEPDIPPSVAPTAGFEIASSEALTFTFQNTSQNAASYAWDFGDGNSSTLKDPTHTYEDVGTYTVKLTATNSTGSNDFSLSVTATSPYKSDGYLVSSLSSSSGATSYFGGYFGTEPSGSIDLTTSSSFQRLQFRTQYKGFLYGYPTNNEPGLAKMAIDKDTDELVTVDEIPLFDFPGTVIILDDNTGIFSKFVSTEIEIFNPMTMEITGSIDMSGGFTVDTNDQNGYGGMVYNEQQGKIYAILFTNNPMTPQFYDADEVYVEVIDAATLTREKTIVHPNAEYPVFRGETTPVHDDAGNTYLLTQGTYGLDNNFGPAAPKGSRPQILKIDTNSDFDTTYAFNPINALGLQNNFFQLFTSMVGAGNNKAYGIGTAQGESPQILALLQKLAAGTITSEEYDQLVNLVLFDESMKLIEVDLVGKTASFTSGSPLTAGFAYPFMYNYSGRIFAQITSASTSFNGFYEIDPNSNSATPFYNLTAGGFAYQLMDLAEGFK
ncbi:MAG: PKD domain-containing protein [Bacteroidota bacterium]